MGRPPGTGTETLTLLRHHRRGRPLKDELPSGRPPPVDAATAFQRRRQLFTLQRDAHGENHDHILQVYIAEGDGEGDGEVEVEGEVEG